MSKRKASVKKKKWQWQQQQQQTEYTDLYIPDEIWGVIASHLPWDDVATLLSFLCVSRGAIQFVLPCVKELCAQFQRPHYDRDYPLIKMVVRCFFGPSLRLPLVVGQQRKTPTSFCIEELKLCMLYFHRLEESALTMKEWREHSASLLSVVHLATLQEKYNNKVCPRGVSNFRLREPRSSDSLSHLFYCPLGTPRATQRLKKVANVRIAEGMEINTSQLNARTERWIMTRCASERERQIYWLALKSARGNNIRAICYYIMANNLQVSKAKSCSLFGDILLVEEKKEQAKHIYTSDCAVTKNFIERCVYYDGSAKEARKVLELETYMNMYRSECAQRCVAMKNLFLEKAPITSKIWEHATVPIALPSSSSSSDEEEWSFEEEWCDVATEEEEEGDEWEDFIMPLPGSQ